MDYFLHHILEGTVSSNSNHLKSALSVVGADATQVTTNKLLRPRKQGKILPPDVGKMSLGFASFVGKFDALVDTLTDESRLGESRCIGDSDDWSNDASVGDECKSAVIVELEKQHDCKRFVMKIPILVEIVLFFVFFFTHSI